MITVPVVLGERSYDVVIGPGARHELAGLVARTAPGAQRAVVVTQENIGVEVDPGLPFEVCMVPDGESAKSLRTVEYLVRRFARLELSRSDVVVAVGGGVVTDLTGFTAAAFHRGVAYVSVATSLLAQVDAAIGGKTGVNLPEGKNLVGAFWQPRGVLCDTEVLTTLPEREWVSGRGEMAKYLFIDRSATPGGGPDRPQLVDLPLDEQVARCVEVKANVVAADEREGDRRMVLNYGHTLAHALEASGFGAEPTEGAGSRPGYELRHGEAVAVGLLFAARLACRLGRIDAERVEQHRRILGAFALPMTLPQGVSSRRLIELMQRDKKAHHDLSFVLDGPNGLESVSGVPVADVMATLGDMGAST